MSFPVRLCLTLHNHQPIGNFGHVFEQAYRDSYLPFLEVLEKYPDVRIALHTSGPLMEWLDAEHGDYLDRIAELVAAHRIEIVGGAYYEPVLTMIPGQDRIGQIKTYSRWLEQRFQCKVRGMWIPERVWEQALASDISSAGIEYTVLDDFHFRNAGLEPDALHGHYVTEDQGNIISVFPGSERLRYLIPFSQPHKTIDYLREIGQRFDNAVVMFGDDGEKFGTWPDTRKHVYDDGWLHNMFQALTDNKDWLKTTTPGEALDNTPSRGKIYLPDGSYREMTEWALPTRSQQQYEDLQHEFAGDERWHRAQRYLRGGYWRNFKTKYLETDEMYARMMAVSRRLQQAQRDGLTDELLEPARRELFRGQCNCSYWHGAFGGVYLPHLRNAIYNHLIAADNLLDPLLEKPHVHVEATAMDLDFDGRQEIRLENDQLVAFFKPNRGGQMYELDVRSICHNLLATLARRPEAYHRTVLKGDGNNQDVASIHDRVVFKQEGLDQRLQYDGYPRKSLIDHFYPLDVSREAVERCEAPELGNFIWQPYEARLRRNPDRLQVMMTNKGQVEGMPVTITKGVTLEAGSTTLEISYLLEGLPQDRDLHFGIEFNFAGLPPNADGRYFHDAHGENLGHLGQRLDINACPSIGMTDQWLGMRIQLRADCPTDMWTFPIETVSQSEGGYELVHQSIVVQPHWLVRGDENGQWAVQMTLDIDTSMAMQRQQANTVAAAK